jgi:uncharacterized protein (TIGR02271 family)
MTTGQTIVKEDASRIIGTDVYDTQGKKIGSVGQIYLDNDTGEPEWISVRTGLFGMKESFVPLRQAHWTSNGIVVPYAKDLVKDAPRIEADAELSPAQESELYNYYGISYTTAGAAETRTTETRTTETRPTETRPTEARMTETRPAGEESMTRSEERLKVGTETTETGKVRLRKYTVTEQQQMTVPVSHEEVRVVREPVTETTRGEPGQFTEEEREVTLHAERPVVGTETVATERVHLETDTVSEQETVSGKVRKERIEAETDVENPDRDIRR